MLCMVVGGLGLILVMASGNTFIQTIVHDKKRGRVMSLYTTVVMGVAPFGSLVAGSMATRFGEPHTIMVAGSGCILAGLVFR
jgi:MFS family permease